MIVQMLVMVCDCAALHGDHAGGCPRDLPTYAGHSTMAKGLAGRIGWKQVDNGQWLSPQCAQAVAEHEGAQS